MKRFWIYVIMIALMGVGFAQADEPLTLEQAIFSALENNISLNQVRTQVESANVQVHKEESDSYPDLTLNIDSMLRYDSSANQRAIWMSDETKTEYIGAKLVSNMTVFDGSKNKLSLERARLDHAAANDSFSRSRQSIIFETISRFVSVILNQQLIEVEERNLDVNRQQLDRINSFFKAGNRPINDLYQQRAKTSQAELKILSAKHDLEVSKLVLSQIMGDVGETHFQVKTPNPPIFENTNAQPSAEQILTVAMKQRLDIVAQEKKIQSAMKKIQESKAGYWPNISLSVQAGTNYNNLLDAYDFTDQFVSENPYAAVGLSMDLPIFDRRRISSDLERSMIQLKSEKLKLAELEQQVDMEVRKAVLDYNTANLQLDVAKKQLVFASQAFKSSKERYDLGTSDLVSLTQSMDQLAQASYDKVKATYNHLLANLGIAYYSGDLDSRLMDWQAEFKKTLTNKTPAD